MQTASQCDKCPLSVAQEGTCHLITLPELSLTGCFQSKHIWRYSHNRAAAASWESDQHHKGREMAHFPSGYKKSTNYANTFRKHPL